MKPFVPTNVQISTCDTPRPQIPQHFCHLQNSMLCEILQDHDCSECSQFELQQLILNQNTNFPHAEVHRVTVREFCIDPCLIRAHLHHNRNKGKLLLWVGKAKEKETEL